MAIEQRVFKTAQHALPYLLATPTAGPDEPLPLVVFLHGAKDRGDDLSKLLAWGFPKLVSEAATLPYYWLALQIPLDTTWPQWQAELFALIDQLAATHAIDTGRVILSGFSLGAAGTWEIGSQHADRFAALVAVSGRLPETVGEGGLSKLVDTPVWVFHGGQDDKAPAAGAQAAVDTLNALGGNARFTLIADGDHFIAEAAFGDPALQQWLLEQSVQAVAA
ncbi:Alpha/beta hydrolase family protein [Andreprevotia lacus DSM 23236]|jgi:predicted peptidase|uniref:Alpha/beta hydrolase family protein n=1 Tax=Andreprevotia lacus DSM 23236 TaxID=1121001 RepID=A0A1W1Y1D9_9NEIS|nr:dienelactone hydrolase family protein [Andreprevotia lacus]SMC29945.1 Alpha/beta hydrolase family protein [Andreprevotia lacus DSM 23236]